MMMDLDDYFNSKDIPYTKWKIEHEGKTHYVDSDILKDSILSSKGAERDKIAGILRSLDFMNLPVQYYMETLATELVHRTYKNVTNE